MTTDTLTIGLDVCALPPVWRAPARHTLRFAAGHAFAVTISALPRSVAVDLTRVRGARPPRHRRHHTSRRGGTIKVNIEWKLYGLVHNLRRSLDSARAKTEPPAGPPEVDSGPIRD